MHPAIAAFPSDTFYDGRLRDGVGAADRPAPSGIRWPDRQRPVTFLAVDGVERRARADDVDDDAGGAPGSAPGSALGSISNRAEADAVCAVVRAALGAGLAPRAVGVITPYSAQVQP